jgi:hypothetical protein
MLKVVRNNTLQWQLKKEKSMMKIKRTEKKQMMMMMEMKRFKKRRESLTLN